jgi:signal transduction histidine kinase/ABC-type uncharacterized transport system substrate-binding protein
MGVDCLSQVVVSRLVDSFVASSHFVCTRKSLTFCLLFVLTIGWAATPLLASQDTTDPKRVLILFTFRRNLPINALWERGIRTGIDREFPSVVAYDCEFIDFDRLKSPVYREQWLSLLRVKYAENPPDVVIPVHDLATTYFANSQPNLFPNAGVVYCSITEGTLTRLPLDRRGAGVGYQLDFQETMAVARQMFPKANQVVVVSGSGEMDLELVRACQEQFPDQNAIRFDYWTGLPINEICTRAAQLNSESIILFLAYECDRDGKIAVSTRDVLQSLSQSANAPVFGLYDSLMGAGVVGGVMAKVEEQGVKAGIMAARLLEGEDVQETGNWSVEVNNPMFDWRELERWGIDTKHLPEGSEIYFRTPSIWSIYWPYITLVGAAIGIQLFLIAALLINRRNRMRAQNKLNETLNFQTTVSKVSAELLQDGSARLQFKLDEALENITSYFGLRYWRVFKSDGPHSDFLTLVSCDPHAKITDQPKLLLKDIQGLWNQIQTSEMFIVRSQEDLREVIEGDGALNSLGRFGSTIIVPLAEHRIVFGFIVLGRDDDCKIQPELLSDRVQIFGNLISQFLSRARANQVIAESRYKARRLAGKLLTAQEDERKRISREIHDDICQRLVAAGIQVGMLEREVIGSNTALNGLKGLKESLNSLSADVQRISRKLHPAILDELGLIDAIRSECNRFAERGMLQVDFRFQPVPENLDKGIALCLYRITQEALWNVVKHAGVDRASIRLFGDVEFLYLEVSDQGRGFDPNIVQSGNGIGLMSFHERVRYLGGKVEINSALGHGTKILITLPIDKEHS